MTNKYYIHIKSGVAYQIIGKALNCTTGQKDQTMVIYKNKNGFMFTRELSEFNLKFQEVK